MEVMQIGDTQPAFMRQASANGSETSFDPQRRGNGATSAAGANSDGNGAQEAQLVSVKKIDCLI